MNTIIKTINEAFGGDINDKRPLHINSTCRIAYAGYLKYHKKHSCKELAEITGASFGISKERAYKHRGYYAMDPTYRRIFDNILNNLQHEKRN